MLDNARLSSYLNSAGRSLCGSGVDHTQMITCLQGYNSSMGVIFDDSIADSPRFGWVPLFHEATLGPGNTTLTIKDFRPVYIQTTLWGCNANSCDLVWDPGEPFGPGPNNVKIEASSAIQIPGDALPSGVVAGQPGSDSQVEYLLSR